MHTVKCPTPACDYETEWLDEEVSDAICGSGKLNGYCPQCRVGFDIYARAVVMLYTSRDDVPHGEDTVMPGLVRGRY